MVGVAVCRGNGDPFRTIGPLASGGFSLPEGRKMYIVDLHGKRLEGPDGCATGMATTIQR
jgi:hypothetical protein